MPKNVCKIKPPRKGETIKNYYKDLDIEVLKYLHKNIRAKIEHNKEKHREYKSLESELQLITAVLMTAKPTYAWQERKDLQ